MIGLLLLDPKFPHNLGAAVRAASIWGADRLIWTGTRAQVALDEAGGRLPREERHKAYAHVDWRPMPVGGLVQRRPLDLFPGCTPVCVEVLDQAEPLWGFVHPAQAVYVFGPEDGGVPQAMRAACHRFVRIPTPNRTPLNLAAAINVVLGHRAQQKEEAWRTSIRA